MSGRNYLADGSGMRLMEVLLAACDQAVEAYSQMGHIKAL